MGLFSKTRRGHTLRVRTGRKLLAGIAAAVVIAGAGSASAVNFSDQPGVMFHLKNTHGVVADLGVMGYKDGLPFYCLDVDAPYTNGDENKGQWKAVDDPHSRIAAQMVHDSAASRDDLVQAAVAYAIHLHFDRDQSHLSRLMAGGFDQTPITPQQVTNKAAQLWRDASMKTPGKAEARTTGADSPVGTIAVGLTTEEGTPIKGIEWRIGQNKGTAKIAFDGPTSGTTGEKPVTVAWHALSAGSVDLSVEYKDVDAQKMDGSEGHQSLLMAGRQERWYPVGTQFRITAPEKAGVTTQSKVPSDIKPGSSQAVKDHIHISVGMQGKETLKGESVLHYDGSSGVKAASVSKPFAFTGDGDVDSASFSPADFGWTGNGKTQAKGWKEGTYWFDVKIPKQKGVATAIDAPDREKSETFTVGTDPKPQKSVTQKDSKISIDGKKVVPGDTLLYHLTLDATHLSSPIARLGMVDDYDEATLRIDKSHIRVLDEKGADVSVAFAIDVDKGSVSVFARTGAGKENSTIVPDKLLGHSFEIVLPATVLPLDKEQNITNKAVEIVNDATFPTNAVTNPVTVSRPQKAVVTDNSADGKDLNGTSIPLGQLFMYELRSSVRPKGLAYPVVSKWEVSDKLDGHVDVFDGWAVYAQSDIFSSDGKLIAPANELIASDEFDSSAFAKAGILRGKDKSLFAATQQTDGTLTIAATDSYKKLVSDGNRDASWVAYIRVFRIGATKKCTNTFTETINDASQPSNTVWTSTPRTTKKPAKKQSVHEVEAYIAIEKYDCESGLKKGDRDKPEQALEGAHDGTRLCVLIANTGKAEQHRFTFSDATIEGDGSVAWNTGDLEHLKKLVLKPGEKFTVHGTLHGITRSHRDRVTVTTVPIASCPAGMKKASCNPAQMRVQDDWNGNAAHPLASTGARTEIWVGIAAVLLIVGCTVVACAHHRRFPSAQMRKNR